MGASGWSYVVPYTEDPAAALSALRERVLAKDDFYWEAVEDLGSKPATLTELDTLRETEEFWEVGTHSILDVDHVVPADSGFREGSIRPLIDADARSVFGTTTPTRTEFENVTDSLPDADRWSGFYQLLYTGDQPAEIAFWGVSGD